MDKLRFKLYSCALRLDRSKIIYLYSLVQSSPSCRKSFLSGVSKTQNIDKLSIKRELSVNQAAVHYLDSLGSLDSPLEQLCFLFPLSRRTQSRTENRIIIVIIRTKMVLNKTLLLYQKTLSTPEKKVVCGGFYINFLSKHSEN